MADITFRDAKVEINPGGAGYTDISGQTNTLTVSGGDKQIGSFFAANSDDPTLGVGKHDPIEITLLAKYTESAAQAYGLLEAAWEADTEVVLRWSPQGGAVTQWQYTTGSGFVQTIPYAGTGQAVESGDALRLECVVIVPSIARSVVS